MAKRDGGFWQSPSGTVHATATCSGAGGRMRLRVWERDQVRDHARRGGRVCRCVHWFRLEQEQAGLDRMRQGGANTCDVCGQSPAPHCIGGEDYYCEDHAPYDTFEGGA